MQTETSQARKTLSEALRELKAIMGRSVMDEESKRVMVDLEQWQRRVVEEIRQHVSVHDANQFARLSIPAYWIRVEPIEAALTHHISLLEGLLSEISEGAERRRNHKVPRSVWLMAIGVGLAALTFLSVTALAHLAAVKPPEISIMLMAAPVAFDRSWVLAAFAGLLGGSVRAVFMLIVENYAFAYRSRTGKTSEWSLRMLSQRGSLRTIDDDFDPLTNWWAYLLKPALGLGFGFLFGLLQLVGLIPFLNSASTNPDVAVVVVGVLAGILTEEAISKLQDIFSGSAKPNSRAH
jgi:hypothetical protein